MLGLLGRHHETRKVFGAPIAVVASVLGAVAMVGNVTWVEETNWFLFGLAGFGVVGFGIMALEQWHEWPTDTAPAWTHWFGSTFWPYSGPTRCSD